MAATVTPVGPAREDNIKRAAKALAALRAYPGRDERDTMTSIVDLLGDLMHLADTYAEGPGDGSHAGLAAVESAQRYYLAEFYGKD